MQGPCCCPRGLLPGSNAGPSVHPDQGGWHFGCQAHAAELRCTWISGVTPTSPRTGTFPALARDVSSHVTSTVPRGEGSFLHTPSYQDKVTCSTSHQEFREISTHLNHEHRAQTFHLGLTQNKHQLVLLLPGTEHRGPPMGPSPPRATPRQCLALRVPNSVPTCTWGKRQSK